MIEPAFASPRPRSRAVARFGRMLFIAITGFVVDVCAIMNVPGTVVHSSADGEVHMAGSGPVLVLVVAASWKLMLLWRREPLAGFIAGAVLAVIGISYLLLLVAAVELLRRRPGHVRPAAAVVGGLVTGFVLRETLTDWGGALPWFFASSSTDQQSAASIIGTIVVAVLSVAAAAGAVYVSHARARVIRSDGRAAQEQQRADALTEEMARQSERERIARDMHDALAHRLSVVSLHAGALEASAVGDGAQEIARTVREQTHAALQDMRGLIGELRSGPSDAAPTTMRALGSLIAELRSAGVPISAQVVIESPERASAGFDSAVHRIVQESLTNAIKHAPGSPIDVFVQVSPSDGARIRVENALRPVASTVPGGQHGIAGIRERAAALGGAVWIGPHEGRFIVDATLPWQENS